eukprot:2402655-Pleurochrysis_carterae.AAC.5
MASPASGQATEMFNPPTIPRNNFSHGREKRSKRTDGRSDGGSHGGPGAPRSGEGASIRSTHPTVLEARGVASPRLRDHPRPQEKDGGGGRRWPVGPRRPPQSRRDGRPASWRIRRP